MVGLRLADAVVQRPPVGETSAVDPEDGPMPAAVYFKDTSDGVFTGTNAIGVAAFEYDVAGDHLFYPNYRVFLITSDSANRAYAFRRTVRNQRSCGITMLQAINIQNHVEYGPPARFSSM